MADITTTGTFYRALRSANADPDLSHGAVEEVRGMAGENVVTAIRADIGELRSELHGEIATLRTELHGEIAKLRTELHGEIAKLRTELHSEIGNLRAELSGEIGTLRTELHSEIGNLRAELSGEIGELRGMMVTANRLNAALVIILGGGVVAILVQVFGIVP